MPEGSGIPGKVQDVRLPDTILQGELTKAAAEGSEVKMPVAAGMTMLVVYLRGVYASATVVMEVSPDGEHWFSVGGANINSGTSTNQPITLSTNSTSGWECAIPAGSIEVRARCTAITSGAIIVTLAQGSSDYETSIASVISGSANFAALGAWVDLSSTNLGGGATFTGASQELSNQTSGTAFATLGTGGQGEVRVSATSDKAGTLYLETSRDNATWTRVKGVVMAKFDGTCENYAEIVHKPSERYCRAVYVNGAEAQGKFKCQLLKVATV